ISNDVAIVLFKGHNVDGRSAVSVLSAQVCQLLVSRPTTTPPTLWPLNKTIATSLEIPTLVPSNFSIGGISPLSPRPLLRKFSVTPAAASCADPSTLPSTSAP